MDVDSDIASRSVVRTVPPAPPRKLNKVPFVELADGRVQGVVSSGSDPSRVYVSSVAVDHTFSCSTNNNRPCSGARGGHMCKHLDTLLTEAVAAYGFDRVARFLAVEGDPSAGMRHLLTDAHLQAVEASIVFSRFLRYLTYLGHPSSTETVPELHWFPVGGGN